MKNDVFLSVYADMLTVVAFFVVNMFGCSIITRHHGCFEGHHLVEILPTGLPELFKPSGTRDSVEKPQLLEFKLFLNSEKCYGFLINSFKRGIFSFRVP